MSPMCTRYPRELLRLRLRRREPDRDRRRRLSSLERLRLRLCDRDADRRRRLCSGERRGSSSSPAPSSWVLITDVGFTALARESNINYENTKARYKTSRLLNLRLTKNMCEMAQRDSLDKM
ncbi:hypothetical protein M514_04920 [Trichuris suis]|uniref:Uncharacterized protein n=1 Tax=Trichuris suis TaxID=68888 RepID=A0A085MA97_9BILA|nr:hypothetical protein M513_04920 [Trichuris suis]KFD71237.1 hypothetical protein M514_04920 [Trichuris suis]